jgi:hypothetical protein
MRRLIPALLLAACLLPAQTKKIVFYNPAPGQVEEFQAISPKVKMAGATPATIQTEIADADGFIGVITPQM